MKTERLMRSRWAAIGAAVAVTLGAGGVFAAGAVSQGTPTAFEPLSPVRILDTRTGVGVPAAGKLPAGQEIVLTVPGSLSGVPADATSVVLNLTSANGTSDSFITVYPDGETRPNASVLNVQAGKDTPNMITVKLGTAGKIRIYNNSGNVDVLADIAGYFRPQQEVSIRWGRFDSAGTLQQGNIGININRQSVGFYQSNGGGADFLKCSYTASILADSFTSTAREIIVNRGIFPTDVRVQIFTSAGALVDAPFSIVSYCPPT